MATEDVTTYIIKAQQQSFFNRETGERELVAPYTGKVWGVQILDGRGETSDPKIALEFLDMGYDVTPDPRPAVQDAAIAALKGNEDREKEYDRLRRDVATWRKAHGIAVVAKEGKA